MCVCLRQFADLQAENEDMQHSVQKLKMKCKKLTTELQDTKLHIQGLQSRNYDLEKKQKKSVFISSPACPSLCPSFFLIWLLCPHEVSQSTFMESCLCSYMTKHLSFFNLNSDYDIFFFFLVS